MSITEKIAQIDWKDEKSKMTADDLIRDAAEYMRRVEAHIYKGNEIRADQCMDYSEKQDEIKRLDRKRTEAHNKLLVSAGNFIDLLEEKTDFDRSEYKLNNRTQIADFVASIVFELMNTEPASKVEGNIRDDLAEKIHNGDITMDTVNKALSKYLNYNMEA